MAPVARELAPDWGVLEPIQTATSLQGQVEELRAILEKNGDLPAILIGFSWGAWLSFIVAAKYPEIAKKLVLIGSGAFEEKYAARIQETRLNRLGEAEKTEVKSLIQFLDNSQAEGRSTAFARLGALFSKADACNPILDEPERIDYRADIFQSVWKNGAKLRKSGRLQRLGKRIECPVVAIHGDYDPHPAEGVREPLSVILKRFRFVLLKDCGHRPWIEREAGDIFYGILKKELRQVK